jgi:hypothetical protein
LKIFSYYCRIIPLKGAIYFIYLYFILQIYVINITIL